MKIRMKVTIAGTFHGRPEGVQRGDVVEIDDVWAVGYCASHLAEPVVERREERAVVAVEAEVRGGGEASVAPAVEPVVEPEPEPEVEPEKRGPGRPRKVS